MSEKTLKFDDNNKINKKNNASEQAIGLNLVDTNKIVLCDKFKHSDDGFKDFISYKKDIIVRPVCIILPLMSIYIKYFEQSLPVYDKKYIKAKVREYNGVIETKYQKKVCIKLI